MKESVPRVVITGLCPITALGMERAVFWKKVKEGRSPVQVIQGFDVSSFTSKHAVEIADFSAEKYFTAKELRRLDRYAQFALLSARGAVKDAGLSELLDGEKKHRDIGVCIGSALGGFSQAEAPHAEYVQNGMLSPFVALKVYGGSAQGAISLELGLQGVGASFSNGCASGNTAVAEAFRAIQHREARIMLAVGAEAPITAFTFGSFDKLHVMSTWNGDSAHAYRPFDQQRDGFVLGEGAACLILEEREHALQRGATIYAEVLGYHNAHEAWHITQPRPGGECLRELIASTLEKSHLKPADIDYINAHASGTQQNDTNEAKTIQALFEKQKKSPLVSATKPFTGHMLGATGAMEALICALALHDQYAPPTPNLETPDSGISLDLLAQKGRHVELNACLNLSFGFGGVITCLALKKHA